MDERAKTRSYVRRLVLTAVTAAVYTAASMFVPFPIYREVQFRFSEILNLLAFINPAFAPGMILGCFITNLFSPFPLDWLVGTTATVLTMLCVTRSKTLLAASLWPTFFCFLVGAEITFYSGAGFNVPQFAIITLTVMAGEFIVMTLIGWPAFKYLMKNEKLVRFFKSF